MKQYLLSIFQPDGEPPPPDVLGAIMRDVNAVVEEARAAGAWVFNAGLHPPSTSTVLRVQRGELLVIDGPYIEGKEHIGGFLIVKAADLDAALGWAGKLARAISVPGEGGVRNGLAIEVRPIQGGPEH